MYLPFYKLAKLQESRFNLLTGFECFPFVLRYPDVIVLAGASPSRQDQTDVLTASTAVKIRQLVSGRHCLVLMCY